MKTAWAELVVALVLWLGVAALLWALGAWLLLAVMDEDLGAFPVETIARVAILIVLGAGILIARRSPTGYAVLAGGALACVGTAAAPAAGGSFMGGVTVAIAAVTAVAAVARWALVRTARPGPRPVAPPSPDVGAARAVPAAVPRPPMETAVAAGLAVAGLVVLGRVILELVEGLAELPGASEHWAGDVILGLILGLPLPVLAGAAMLGTAAWLWRRRVGTVGAVAVAVVAVGLAVAWILIEAAWFLAQGSYWGSLDDPLLWAPVGVLVGAAAGAVVLAVLLAGERGRRHAPG